MTTSQDIDEYNAGLEPAERGLCERLAEVFSKELPEATRRVWHAHPVWFIDGNPVVGYATRKNGVSVLFWSGQSFAEPGLKHTGSFKAAEFWPSTADDLDVTQLERWLSDARRIQWNYRDIRSNRGLVNLTVF